MTNAAVLVIVDHQKMLASDFKDRFFDLKQFNFLTCVMQSVLVDQSDVSMQYKEELSEMQHVKALFTIKGAMVWSCDETETNYPNETTFVRKLLLQCHSHLYIWLNLVSVL